MRIILDTNVLVSALIQRNYPYFILDHILADPSLKLCVSDSLFDEYIEVLNREKFSRFKDFHFQAKLLLIDLKSKAINYDPKIRLNLIKDQPDNRLLELSETCNANYIVTGNITDFTMIKYKNTRIISPKEMYNLLIL